MIIKIDMPLDKVIGNEPHNVVIGEQEVIDSLYDICDANHAGCNIECPVWAANGGAAPVDKAWQNECSCFKNGRAMLNFLRKMRDEYERSMIL